MLITKLCALETSVLPSFFSPTSFVCVYVALVTNSHAVTRLGSRTRAEFIGVWRPFQKLHIFPHSVGKPEAFVSVIRPCSRASTRRHGMESTVAEAMLFRYIRRRLMVINKQRKRGPKSLKYSRRTWTDTFTHASVLKL